MKKIINIPCSDPWNNIDERYQLGMKVEGIVIRKTNYGYYIEIEEGIECLLHNSDINYMVRAWFTSQISEGVGSKIEGAIIEINEKNRRIALKV